MKAQYAAYKGDKFLCFGSKQRIADYLGVSKNTVSFYCMPSYQRRAKEEYNDRMLVIRIEDDEE